MGSHVAISIFSNSAKRYCMGPFDTSSDARWQTRGHVWNNTHSLNPRRTLWSIFRQYFYGERY